MTKWETQGSIWDLNPGDQICTEGGEIAEQRRFYIEMAPGGLENEIEYVDKLKLRRSSSRFAVRTWLTNNEMQELNVVLSREFEIESEIMQDVEE
jgi:hypothetical protein